MPVKMKELLANANSIGKNKADAELKNPLLFVFIGNFDRAYTRKLIANLITDKPSVGSMFLFSDDSNALVQRAACENSLEGRKWAEKAITAESAYIKEGIQTRLVDILNGYNRMSFESQGELRVNYVFNAADIYCCSLSIISDMIRDICSPSYSKIQEDFYCMYSELLRPGSDGKVRNAFKYLTLKELEEIIPPVGDKNAHRSCYLLSDRHSDGILRDMDAEKMLGCICNFNILRSSVAGYVPPGGIACGLDAERLRSECAYKYGEGRFYELGSFHLEKDEAFIQAVVTSHLLDKVNGEVTEDNSKTLIEKISAFNADKKMESFVARRIKISDGMVDIPLFFRFCKKPLSSNDIPQFNGEAAAKIYGRSIDRYIEINITEPLREYMVEMAREFERELCGQINDYFVRSPQRSAADIAYYLRDSDNSLRKACAEALAAAAEEKDDKLRAFDYWKSRTVDSGNLTERSIAGESEMIYYIAGKYFLYFLEAEKPDIKRKFYEKCLEITDKYIAKYAEIDNAISDTDKKYKDFIRSRADADDISRRGVNDFYSEVMENADKRFALEMSSFRIKVNDEVCAAENRTLSQFMDKFTQLFDNMLKLLYDNIEVLQASFADECAQRLKGQNINRLVEDEIRRKEPGIYMVNRTHIPAREYKMMGILSYRDDSITRYLLTRGLKDISKCVCYRSGSGDDFDIVFVRGSFGMDDITSCTDRWKKDYEELNG